MEAVRLPVHRFGQASTTAPLEQDASDLKEVVVEDLQSLLERIQKEGVDRAEAQAAEIVAAARRQAHDIVSEAKRQADETVTAGERDAEVFMERATTALEHSARDFLLQVQHNLETLFLENVRGELSDSLTPELMTQLVSELVQSYADSSDEERRIDVRLAPGDYQRFVDIFMDKYRAMIGAGVEIHADDRIRRGFRVSFQEGNLYHDFTLEALADALGAMLRPPLRDIVRRAAAATKEPSLS